MPVRSYILENTSLRLRFDQAQVPVRALIDDIHPLGLGVAEDHRAIPSSIQRLNGLFDGHGLDRYSLSFKQPAIFMVYSPPAQDVQQDGGSGARPPFAGAPFLEQADSLSLDFVQCAIKGSACIAGHLDANKGLITKLQGDLRDSPVLLGGQNNVHLEPITKDTQEFSKTFLRILPQVRTDFDLSAGEINTHGLASWSLIETALKVMSQAFTRRWWVLGIRMSSRYLATVRRVTLYPSSRRRCVICSSVRG